jgi:type VI secretion system protein ImpC
MKSMPERSSSEHSRRMSGGLDLNGTPGILEGIIQEGRFGRDPASSSRGKDLVKEFVSQVVDGSMTVSRDAVAMINQRIAQIDHLVSLQLNEVLHAPEFQELESAWRGLFYLMDRTAARYYGIKIRVLNVSKRELWNDFEGAVGVLQSTLGREVVDECLDTLGAEPFSILLCNYSFINHSKDRGLFERVSAVAAAAHAPFLSSAGASLFNCDSLVQVLRAPDLKKLLGTSESGDWDYFRRHERAGFAAFALPGILLRRPYGRDGLEIRAFRYEEGVDGTNHLKFLWGNPAWAVAAQVARAFGQGSWCADPASFEGGGVIRKLPSFAFRTNEGDLGEKGPTEASISDTAYAQLCDLGFAPVCRDATGSRAVIFEIPTAQKRPDLEDEDGEVQRQPPVMLRDVLIRSRIAQYIKCIVREKRAWFETPEQCERYLNRWAAKYTVPQALRNAADEYRQPFLEAEFTVVKDPPRPEGWFRVEGRVLPALAKGQTPIPVDISVRVLLTRSAADWQPPSDILREDDQGTTGEPEPTVEPAVAATVAPRRIDRVEDPFEAACGALERLADLKREHILDDADFLDLKAAILKRIKSLAAPEVDSSEKTAKIDKKDKEAEPDDYSAPYAQLHAHIVDLIAEPYRGGADAKQRAQKSLAVMEEHHALNEGDSALLTELLETSLADVDEEPSKRMGVIKSVAAKIRAKRNASPASRAIAETAEQSGTRAENQYPVERKADSIAGFASHLWRKLVWPDVEGAFSGGAAAAAISPALAPYQFPWPVQMAAAIGVVIGAGIRSGVAYGEAALNERVSA